MKAKLTKNKSENELFVGKQYAKLAGVMLYYVRKDMKYKQKGRQKWRKKN